MRHISALNYWSITYAEDPGYKDSLDVAFVASPSLIGTANSSLRLHFMRIFRPDFVRHRYGRIQSVCANSNLRASRGQRG